MSSSIRTIFRALTAVLLVSATASAQDRLFTPTPDGTRVVEIGAIGRFGQVLGPAPSDAFDFPGKARLYDVTTTAVTDAQTGAVLWTPNPGEVISLLTSSHDRTTVYAQTYEVAPGFVLIDRLRAIDGATGAVVAEARERYASVTWDPAGRRVLAWNYARRSFDVFTERLLPLGSVVVGNGSRCQSPDVVVSPHTGRAYISYSDATHYYGSNFANLVAVDLTANRFVGYAELGNTSTPRCGQSVMLWSAPAPPPGLSATVTGRDVTLSWIPADYAAGYVLDAGVAPSRTDLTVPLGDVTQVSFANVPPGTYYLRVRGGNRMGGGRPSNEVRVVVP